MNCPRSVGRLSLLRLTPSSSASPVISSPFFVLRVGLTTLFFPDLPHSRSTSPLFGGRGDKWQGGGNGGNGLRGGEISLVGVRRRGRPERDSRCLTSFFCRPGGRIIDPTPLKSSLRILRCHRSTPSLQHQRYDVSLSNTSISDLPHFVLSLSTDHHREGRTGCIGNVEEAGVLPVAVLLLRRTLYANWSEHPLGVLEPSPSRPISSAAYTWEGGRSLYSER